MTMKSMKTASLRIGVIAGCVLTLASCGTGRSDAGASIPVTTTSSTTSSASGMGVVQSIDTVQREASSGGGIGLGTVGGAVVGGVLGNQVGDGRGRTAATVAGAVGGGLIGNRVENNSRNNDQAYRVSVRMDNGAIQALVQDTPPSVQVGDRVRVADGVIVERFR